MIGYGLSGQPVHGVQWGLGGEIFATTFKLQLHTV